MTAETSATVPTAPTPRVPRPRLAYIDNLRILLTALVVIHHAAITYGNIPVWFYVEPANGDPSGVPLDVIVIVNQTFFMGFFFMISGMFVPGSVDSKGAKTFTRDRLVRLGIPLLLFLLLARPLAGLPSYLANPDSPPYWLYYLVTWDPGPLWFVEVLLVFSIGYALRRRRSAIPVSAPVAGGFPTVAAIAGFGLVLGVVSFGWRGLVPAGAYWPIIGLPSPAFLPQYLGLFAVGVLAHRKGWFTQIPRAALWWAPALTMLAAVGMVLTLSANGSGLSWQRLVYDTTESFFAIGLILFLMAAFQRWRNRQGSLAKFLSDNAFGVYFLHPLVLVAVALALRGWDGAAAAKFAVLAAIALPATWGAAWLMRRIRLARKVF